MELALKDATASQLFTLELDTSPRQNHYFIPLSDTPIATCSAVAYR